MANRQRSAEREVFWRRQMERHAASGLPIRRYCRDQKISEPSFFVWRKKLQQLDRERSSGPAAEAPHKAGANHQPAENRALATGLVPVQVIDAAEQRSMEIRTPGGVCISLREDASTETLRRVLSACGVEESLC